MKKRPNKRPNPPVRKNHDFSFVNDITYMFNNLLLSDMPPAIQASIPEYMAASEDDKKLFILNVEDYYDETSVQVVKQEIESDEAFAIRWAAYEAKLELYNKTQRELDEEEFQRLRLKLGL